jgi:hypothetical protein
LTLPQRDFLLDPATGDLMIVNGDLVLTSGVDSVRQAIYQALNLYRGEWFLDENFGLPMFEEILVKDVTGGQNFGAVRELLRQYILGAPGVASVGDILLTFDSTHRKASASFTAIADDGTPVVVDGFMLGGS